MVSVGLPISGYTHYNNCNPAKLKAWPRLTDAGHFLAAQPLLALFLTIAIGYLLGAVNIMSFALGSGAVLLVGLALGAAVPALSPPPLLGNLGLLLFLYGVGIAYGAQFWRGLSSADGARANIAATAVMCALGMMLAMVHWMQAPGLGEALGAFAGAGTSTAALQAALAALGSGPATGYSVAYPLGVAVPILMLGLCNALRKPAIAARAASTDKVDHQWIGRGRGQEHGRGDRIGVVIELTRAR